MFNVFIICMPFINQLKNIKKYYYKNLIFIKEIVNIKITNFNIKEIVNIKITNSFY